MGLTDETEAEVQSAARTIHEARRLQAVGRLRRGAGGAGPSVNVAEGHGVRDARWAFSEWKGLVKRRFGGRGALVYSQGAGRAAALLPHCDGTVEVAAVLGMRWRPGKVLSKSSLRGLRPLAAGVDSCLEHPSSQRPGGTEPQLRTERDPDLNRGPAPHASPAHGSPRRPLAATTTPREDGPDCRDAISRGTVSLRGAVPLSSLLQEEAT